MKCVAVAGCRSQTAVRSKLELKQHRAESCRVKCRLSDVTPVRAGFAPGSF